MQLALDRGAHSSFAPADLALPSYLPLRVLRAVWKPIAPAPQEVLHLLCVRVAELLQISVLVNPCLQTRNARQDMLRPVGQRRRLKLARQELQQRQS